MFQRARNVQPESDKQGFGGNPVQCSKQPGGGFRLGDKGQILSKGPPDGGKTCAGSMVDPAGQWGCDHCPIKHPVHNLRRQRFGFVFRMQQPRFGLGQRPEYTG